MINVKLYKQTDWLWRFKKVGFGKGNLGNVGCTTTCLASFLSILGYNLTPPEVAERLRNVGGYTGDLIIWSKIQSAFPNVKFDFRFYKYNNDIVKKFVDMDVPVLVEVMTKYGKHWCLFLGNMKMMDPITGTIVSTSKYNPIGFATLQIKANNGRFVPMGAFVTQS